MRTDEDYERLATQARANLKIADQLRLTGSQLLDAAKERDLIGDYVVLPDSLMANAGGHFDPERRVICITETVWAGSNSGVPRCLYTVAHELSHALLGHTKSRNRSHVRSASEIAAPPIARDERAAERLAAALLAPFCLAEFSLETTTGEIADRFGLSPSAAAIRREEFARMYRRIHNIPRPLPQVVVDFQEESRKRGRSARVIARPAARQLSATAVTTRNSGRDVANTPHYDEHPCPKCGKQMLLAIGVKYLCDNNDCGYVGDLTDGD
jgi:Zn-dependent peptidase ImmA (M78 family)